MKNQAVTGRNFEYLVQKPHGLFCFISSFISLTYLIFIEIDFCVKILAFEGIRKIFISFQQPSANGHQNYKDPGCINVRIRQSFSTFFMSDLFNDDAYVILSYSQIGG
jgi:hypothetical protein